MGAKRRIGRSLNHHRLVGPPETSVAYKQGCFTLAGGKKFVRVEFPKELTTQEKYDVATALARVASDLVREADAANPELAGLRFDAASPGVSPRVTLSDVAAAFAAAKKDGG